MKSKWQDTDIHTEALKYSSKSDFKRNSRGAYEAAVRRGLVPGVCSHMSPQRAQPLTEEVVRDRAKKCSTRTEFNSKAPGAYKYAKTKGIFEEVCAHMVSGKSRKWTLETIHEEALRCNTRNELKQVNSSAYTAALKLGLLDKVCSHMPEPRCKKIPLEELQTEALKYSTRNDFKQGSYGHYQSACRQKVMDVIGEHFVYNQHSFQPMKPAILYYFSIEIEEVLVWKIGVTNYSIEKRYYKRDRDRMSNIQTWEFQLGVTALEHEKSICTLFGEYRYTGDTPFTDGTSTTECFSENIIDKYVNHL